MARDPELIAHQEWLGYLQPVGLVVSPPALLAAQAFPNKNIIPDHARFLDCVENITLEGESDPRPSIRQFARFATHVLGWEPADLIGTDGGGPLPDSLEVTLTEYNETLRPTYAVREFSNAPGDDAKWLLLFQKVKAGISLDDAAETPDHCWQASPQARFERLLRGTQVPIGILSNGVSVRLVYAPHGETSGYLTFPVQAMTEVAGRPIFAAIHMLLSAERLFTLPDKQRLPTILADSRKYQNLVSTKLAEQVLAALYELVRGFQAADDQRHGELLRDVLKDDPNQVYGGLLRVLLRLVFILYAEDRSLLSNDEIYQKFYSVLGLFERLREDAGRHTDTMDHRYGAWAQLLTLFRLIHEGGRHGGLKLLPRKGYLFDPDRYPFLEGRPQGSRRQPGERTEPPRVSDGVVFRVLQNLLILDGERLSYRTLDVEQIGSVYETMMGFNLEVAKGRSVAIKPTKPHGAPTTINLEELLAAKPAERGKWLKEKTGQAATALKDSQTPEDAVAALEKKVAREATPNIVPLGAMVLQPSDERRKSGSHYTPRSLTEPIVRTTLRPILERLGPNPTPAQILDLKVCDPAMGSGAFLVEACRQLAEALVKAWHALKCVPTIPPDEDEILHARRIVAQRCLYGVDKNPMAVDLAKLSLWLVTLAKEHPFTFLDHALRHGDSLVGLTKTQILGFNWKPEKQRDFGRAAIEGQLNRAIEQRRQIREAPDGTSDALLREKLQAADGFLDQGRRYGDLVVSAYFAENSDRMRRERLDSLAGDLVAQRTQYDVDRHDSLEAALRELRRSISPFHWEIEFPEVFDRTDPGFDSFVGNPPFLGGPQLSQFFGGPSYQEWLKFLYNKTVSNVDLSAFFFRRAYSMTRSIGTVGFLATKSISEGGNRSTGLQQILADGGFLYEATRSLRWPGEASVIVAVVHIATANLTLSGTRMLDGKPVSSINSRLLPSLELPDPAPLLSNTACGFIGADVRSSGFIIDHAEYSELARDSKNCECLMPFLGGEEVNSTPSTTNTRYAINFGSRSLNESEAFPSLIQVIRERVKPERDRAKDHGPGRHGKKFWWQYALRADPLYDAIVGLDRCLVTAISSTHLSFSFQPIRQVFAHTLAVFSYETYGAFACLQSRVHYSWAGLLSSRFWLALRFSVGEAFHTFAFPSNYLDIPELDVVGREYYDFRSELMLRNNEGLTSTYNRFHDPEERSPDILKLRELHAAMDKAVLEAYGWTDLQPTCEFLLDYEEDEDEDETGGGRRRKKPWRYRWPDDFRDEVLARLLELNRQRAEEERLEGVAADGTTSGRKKTGRVSARSRKKSGPREKVVADRTLGLFDQLERDREIFYILMLLRAWNKQITRHALDAGLLLMLNDDLRIGLLGGHGQVSNQATSRVVEGLDYVLQELEIKGHIAIDNTGAQQILRVLPSAPATDEATDEDKKRINDVRQFFAHERARGNVTESEERIDARADLIPT